MDTWLNCVNIILALSVPIVLIGGLWNRYRLSQGKGEGGIGWQFIRYTVLALAVPVVALLALNDALSSETANITRSLRRFHVWEGGSLADWDSRI